MSLETEVGSIITPMMTDMNEQELNVVARLRAFLAGQVLIMYSPHCADG
jgi:hypothetical protein